MSDSGQPELEKLNDQQEDTDFAAKNISRESASMLNLLMEQIKTLVEVSNNLNDRTKEVEKRINELTVDSEKRKEESKIMNEKMDMMEKNMEKFIGLYEVVTNQYNPFLENENKAQGVEEEEETEVDVAPAQEQSQQPMQQSQQPSMPRVSEQASDQQSQQAQQPMQQSQPQQPQQIQQPVQQPQPQQVPQQPMGASFSYEDRITGERAYVGDQSQNNQQQNADQNRMYGNPNEYMQGYTGQPQQNLQQNQGMPYGQNIPNQPVSNQSAQQNQSNMNNQQQGGPLLMPTQKQVSSLQDLIEELAVMDDASFYNMVNNNDNQIATWVMNSLGDLQLGTKLLSCNSRIETIKMISRFMHRNFSQDSPGNQVFRFSHGKTVSDVESMLDELIYIDDATFASHVNQNKNDIADWLQGSLGLTELANRVRTQIRKPDMVRELAMYLHSNN
ncbi:MAG: flagella accessory protein C [Candidatus Woesearchaeota archaeon]